jgi:hypothetical protein
MPAWSVEEVQNLILTTVNYSPVVLVILLVSWSFLAYDFSLCGGLLKDGQVLRGKLALSHLQIAFTADLNNIQAVIYLLLFQPIAFILIWSYIKAVRTLPGYTTDVCEHDCVGFLLDGILI